MEFYFDRETNALVKRNKPFKQVSIDCDTTEDYNELKKLFEKAKSKKPDMIGDGYDDDGCILYDTWICPSCYKKYDLDYEEYAFCPNCGQKIDWS